MRRRAQQPERLRIQHPKVFTRNRLHLVERLLLLKRIRSEFPPGELMNANVNFNFQLLPLTRRVIYVAFMCFYRMKLRESVEKRLVVK